MTAEVPPLRTLAEKVNWLIEQAHPADQKPMSDYDLARMITDATGHKITQSSIWKLRAGETANPSWWVIDGLSRVFGVPAGWFSGSLDERVAESLTADIALLAELRDLGVTGAHLNAMRKLDSGTRSAIITMIELAERELAHRPADSRAPSPAGKPRRARKPKAIPGQENPA